MQNYSNFKKILVGVAVFFGFLFVLMLADGGHGSSKAAASSPAGSAADIVMLRGSNSDNSCEENDGDARIYVAITLRNNGDTAGTVEPWATFDYSDGGHSSETYTQNYGHSIDVPAHSEVDATFYHTFNPQQHALIRCAGYVDLGDNEAAGYYLPIS